MKKHHHLDELTLPVSRPVLRYHGGKWRMAQWIIEHLPPHRVYVEPFCGAASVLLQKSRSQVEVLNDLNGRLVNLFRVLRDREQAERLQEMLFFTPYAEQEYLEARQPADDPVEDARRMLVLGFQGHGSVGAAGGKLTGWRRGLRPKGSSSADNWHDLYRHVLSWADRLRGVFIECDDAFRVIERWDDVDTVFYVDPPYLADTRRTGRAYAHELSEADHCALAEVLRQVQGAVVLSGYPSDLYDRLFPDWCQIETQAVCDQGRTAREVLWLSPNALKLNMENLPLFYGMNYQKEER